MPATSSRLGPGTLDIEFVTAVQSPVGCQMSNVRLVPDHSEEDGLPLLCDPAPAPDLVTSWSLQGTAVQDWEDADGFVEQARIHSGETCSFTWTPATDLGVTYSGECQVRAVEIGGEVGARITTDFEFPVVGALVRVDALSGARDVIATKPGA